MAFIEERFPEEIAVGAEGGPEFLTQLVAQLSGFEQRNAAWPVPRRRYTVTLLNRDKTDIDEAMRFMLVVAVGRANGFRFPDFLDFEVEAGEGLLGSGVGTGERTYQLVKRYTYSVYTHDRDITKPRSGTVAVERDGYPVTIGGSPLNAGEFEVNYTTGIVTFAADASASIVQITVGATTEVVLSSLLPTLSAGKKLWLEGIDGSAGATLNNQAWTINSVGSGQAYVLAANTSGLSVGSPGNSGFGRSYPQASETLTWTGEFDVPCRFDIDRMRAAVTVGGQPQNRRATWDSIEIIEIRPRDDE